MHMQVHHRLTRSAPIVNPNVEAVRAELATNAAAHLHEQRPNGLELFRGGICCRRDVSARNNQRVARRNGEGIVQSNCECIRRNDTSRFERAKRTDRFHAD
jgi:hypothetical protein